MDGAELYQPEIPTLFSFSADVTNMLDTVIMPSGAPGARNFIFKVINLTVVVFECFI